MTTEIISFAAIVVAAILQDKIPLSLAVKAKIDEDHLVKRINELEYQIKILKGEEDL